MILPKVRDPRLITIRRGGTLSDDNHHLLALWAAECAEHVLPLFENTVPDDGRAREAIAATKAWAHDTMPMMTFRAVGGHAMGAARPLRGAPRFAAYSAGQAACVGHVAEHDLGASAYAIKAVLSIGSLQDAADERDWQHSRLPAAIRELVLDDQKRRDDLCWNVFSLSS